MKNLIISLFISQLLIQIAFAQQIPILAQNEDYPLFTSLDTNQVRKYLKYLRFGNYDSLKILEFRTYLEPSVNEGDPLAQFLYAKTHDLFAFGKGTPEAAAIALKYYQKAADQNLVLAEAFLYKTYRYNYMHTPTDQDKSLDYLNRMILHGDEDVKKEGYKDLAGLYHRGDFAAIAQDDDKAIEYLEKALKIDPNNTWTLDFVASLYEEKGQYKRAIKTLLESDNINSHLKVADWLIEGEYVPKDLERAISILREKAAIIIEKHGKELNNYMGGENPVQKLNELYCQKMITREQLGEFMNETFQKYHCGN